MARPQTLAHRILAAHLVRGTLAPGSEIAIQIDQTLTQDATGTLAYLQLEALDVDRVRAPLAVSYVDHNTLQTRPENADDHAYLKSVAAKYGVRFSPAGNGICHQLHLERFSRPGGTLLGSDSHTPTAGGAGMLAIGAGGVDVAMAMAGAPYWLAAPRVVGVELRGRLRPWVSAKDVILELLRRLSVKGGAGRIFEYRGEGVATLSVPERATIANMGAELGATTSLFPSDGQTLRYLSAQGRETDWRPLRADPGASYDERIVVDLDALEPLVALPDSPDRVVPVREAAGTPVQQVIVGSCTNSSYRDLLVVARMLEGRRVHPSVSFAVAPGSRQALRMAERAGALRTYLAAGARLLESACGPCIGVGQAPASGSASLRSFNRNFKGRSGTPDARVYLASPEVCAASALTGTLTDPRELGIPYPDVAPIPERYVVDDGFIDPPDDAGTVTVARGPNIVPLQRLAPLAAYVRGPVLLKAGDDVSTDDVLPAGAKTLALRSNVPALAEYAFARLDPTFAQRARSAGGGIVVAGRNYGQGSSREHAALVPRTLGVQAVIAKSFARIHAANLVNFGVLPLVFVDESDYERVAEGDVLLMDHVRDDLARGLGGFVVANVTAGNAFTVAVDLTPRQREIALAGGLLNWLKRATIAAS